MPCIYITVLCSSPSPTHTPAGPFLSNVLPYLHTHLHASLESTQKRRHDMQHFVLPLPLPALSCNLSPGPWEPSSRPSVSSVFMSYMDMFKSGLCTWKKAGTTCPSESDLFSWNSVSNNWSQHSLAMRVCWSHIPESLWQRRPVGRCLSVLLHSDVTLSVIEWCHCHLWY